MIRGYRLASVMRVWRKDQWGGIIQLEECSNHQLIHKGLHGRVWHRLRGGREVSNGQAAGFSAPEGGRGEGGGDGSLLACPFPMAVSTRGGEVNGELVQVVEEGARQLLYL
jgi:hypothetical protein